MLNKNDNSGTIESLISQLKQFAQKEGCSLQDLVSKYAGEEEVSEEYEGDDNKVAMAVARMKSKQGTEETES